MYQTPKLTSTVSGKSLSYEKKQKGSNLSLYQQKTYNNNNAGEYGTLNMEEVPQYLNARSLLGKSKNMVITTTTTRGVDMMEAKKGQSRMSNRSANVSSSRARYKSTEVPGRGLRIEGCFVNKLYE